MKKLKTHQNPELVYLVKTLSSKKITQQCEKLNLIANDQNESKPNLSKAILLCLIVDPSPILIKLKIPMLILTSKKIFLKLNKFSKDKH